MVSALGASIIPLTGCLGQASSGTDPTTTEVSTVTRRDGRRQVRISDVDDAPTDAPLVPSVRVVRADVTADQTARIQTSLTNTTDTPVWNTSTRIRTFSNFITDAGPQNQRIILLQPDGQYDTVSSDCWRADLSTPELNHAYSDVVTDIRYAAGETRSTTFDIYGHPENTGPCLAPGDYPIDTQYAVSANSDTETIEWEYQWGFTITITHP